MNSAFRHREGIIIRIYIVLHPSAGNGTCAGCALTRMIRSATISRVFKDRESNVDLLNLCPACWITTFEAVKELAELVGAEFYPQEMRCGPIEPYAHEQVR